MNCPYCDKPMLNNPSINWVYDYFQCKDCIIRFYPSKDIYSNDIVIFNFDKKLNIVSPNLLNIVSPNLEREYQIDYYMIDNIVNIFNIANHNMILSNHKIEEKLTPQNVKSFLERVLKLKLFV